MAESHHMAMMDGHPMRTEHLLGPFKRREHPNNYDDEHSGTLMPPGYNARNLIALRRMEQETYQ